MFPFLQIENNLNSDKLLAELTHYPLLKHSLLPLQIIALLFLFFSVLKI
jgi:hypothetical protein